MSEIKDMIPQSEYREMVFAAMKGVSHDVNETLGQYNVFAFNAYDPEIYTRVCDASPLVLQWDKIMLKFGNPCFKQLPQREGVEISDSIYRTLRNGAYSAIADYMVTQLTMYAKLTGFTFGDKCALKNEFVQMHYTNNYGMSELDERFAEHLLEEGYIDDPDIDDDR